MVGRNGKYEYIIVAQEGPITTVTIDRPAVYNAPHRPAHLELHDAFDRFAGDPDQWVAIITGAGEKAFCAGNDLKHQAARWRTRLGRVGLWRTIAPFRTDETGDRGSERFCHGRWF